MSDTKISIENLGRKKNTKRMVTFHIRRTRTWSGADPEPFLLRRCFALAAAGGFAVGLLMGKLIFSDYTRKKSVAHNLHVAELLQEIDDKKAENDKLRDIICRMNKSKKSR